MSLEWINSSTFCSFVWAGSLWNVTSLMIISLLDTIVRSFALFSRRPLQPCEPLAFLPVSRTGAAGGTSRLYNFGRRVFWWTCIPVNVSKFLPWPAMCIQKYFDNNCCTFGTNLAEIASRPTWQNVWNLCLFVTGWLDKLLLETAVFSTTTLSKFREFHEVLKINCRKQWCCKLRFWVSECMDGELRRITKAVHIEPTTLVLWR